MLFAEFLEAFSGFLFDFTFAQVLLLIQVRSDLPFLVHLRVKLRRSLESLLQLNLVKLKLLLGLFLNRLNPLLQTLGIGFLNLAQLLLVFKFKFAFFLLQLSREFELLIRLSFFLHVNGRLL